MQKAIKNRLFLYTLYNKDKWFLFTFAVAPLVGAWIEILQTLIYSLKASVAPLVGAWIEIDKVAGKDRPFKSLLS